MSRELEIVYNFTRLDEWGDKINPEAMKKAMAEWSKRGINITADFNSDKVVGQIKDFEIKDNKLYLKGKIFNNFGVSGYVNKAREENGQRIIEDMELFEVSVVPRPIGNIQTFIDGKEILKLNLSVEEIKNELKFYFSEEGKCFCGREGCKEHTIEEIINFNK